MGIRYDFNCGGPRRFSAYMSDYISPNISRLRHAPDGLGLGMGLALGFGPFIRTISNFMRLCVRLLVGLRGLYSISIRSFSVVMCEIDFRLAIGLVMAKKFSHPAEVSAINQKYMGMCGGSLFPSISYRSSWTCELEDLKVSHCKLGQFSKGYPLAVIPETPWPSEEPCLWPAMSWPDKCQSGSIKARCWGDLWKWGHLPAPAPDSIFTWRCKALVTFATFAFKWH